MQVWHKRRCNQQMGDDSPGCTQSISDQQQALPVVCHKNRLQMTQSEKKKIDNIFSHDSLPPLFSDSFRDLDVKWNRIEGINFDTVGRILICHLIIEHYINIFIELEASKAFDFTGAKLTFSQKLKLIYKVEAFKERGIIKGIETLNKIRNKFSHNLTVQIDEADIIFLKEVVDNIHKPEADEHVYSDLAVIELFTSMTCAFMAGYCTHTVDKRKELRMLAKILNEKTAHNK